MFWSQLLGAAVTVALALGQAKAAARHPLAPWQKIGSAAHLKVVNLSRDSMAVRVTAPAVDDASRYLGAVAPCDSAVFHLPYADTDVRVNVAGHTVVFPVFWPDTIRVQALDYQQQACGL